MRQKGARPSRRTCCFWPLPISHPNATTAPVPPRCDAKRKPTPSGVGNTHIASLLAERLKAEHLPQYGVEHAVGSVRAPPILVLTVIAVLISALKSFAEIVVVVIPLHVVAVVAVVRILVGVGALIVRIPPVLTIGLSGAVSLLVAVVCRLPEHVGAVLVRLVVVPASVVLVDRCRIKIRIVVIVGAPVILQIELLLLQALLVLLLEAILRHPILLL